MQLPIRKAGVLLMLVFRVAVLDCIAEADARALQQEEDDIVGVPTAEATFVIIGACCPCLYVCLLLPWTSVVLAVTCCDCFASAVAACCPAVARCYSCSARPQR